MKIIINKNIIFLSIICFFHLILNTCEVPEREARVINRSLSEITTNSARATGEIIDLGDGIADHGHCWSLSANPTISDFKTSFGSTGSKGSFTSYMQNLEPGKKYYVRPYLKSKDNTLYGLVFYFTTRSSYPTLTTTTISSITLTTAISGGNISSDGGAFINSRGVCWATTAAPTISNSKTSDGTGSGSFTSSLSGLLPSTIYHIRAYATNSLGTAYGNELILKTYTVVDIDGNYYNDIKIGTQTWLKENLKTTKYNDGSSIPNITDNTAWAGLTSPGYCWYNNNATTNKDTYGALYNWYSVDTTSNGGRNICPTGWHVPADAEWTTLTNYLGGESVAGGKLKETGTIHWYTPNTGANNVAGFTALPGGLRGYDGTYSIIGNMGFWWSTTFNTVTYAWLRRMDNDNTNVHSYFLPKPSGFSVRCIRD